MKKGLELLNSHMKTAKSCGTVTNEMAEDLRQELSQYANSVFSDNVQLSKDLFKCKTGPEIASVQSKIAMNYGNKSYKEASKISQLLREYNKKMIKIVLRPASWNNH